MNSIPRPFPTRVFHFTHISHLRSVVANGLLSDSSAQAGGLLRMEAGNLEIKEARRQRPVECEPGGMVADYVPFYYAPRSPMLFALHKGNVPTYGSTCQQLVFLTSTTQRLRELGLTVIGTDRNARMQFAEFSADDEEIGKFTRWDVMALRYWNDLPQGGELRQAECLAYGRVPWEAFDSLGTMDSSTMATVQKELSEMSATHLPEIAVRREWYF